MHRHIVKVKITTPYHVEDDATRFDMIFHVRTSDPIKFQSIVSSACTELEAEAKIVSGTEDPTKEWRRRAILAEEKLGAVLRGVPEARNFDLSRFK